MQLHRAFELHPSKIFMAVAVSKGRFLAHRTAQSIRKCSVHTCARHLMCVVRQGLNIEESSMIIQPEIPSPFFHLLLNHLPLLMIEHIPSLVVAKNIWCHMFHAQNMVHHHWESLHWPLRIPINRRLTTPKYRQFTHALTMANMKWNRLYKELTLRFGLDDSIQAASHQASIHRAYYMQDRDPASWDCGGTDSSNVSFTI